MKISFSGHETFVCRQFWLKKGYDYLKDNLSFTREDSVVRLGVGKNMVTSIKFWLRGFHIIDHGEEITVLGEFLLNSATGRDPFLEDRGSLWLLHYAMIRHERVFIFHAFFNEFSKEKNEFTREQLITFLKRKTDEAKLNPFSDKTYEADSNVFLRTYVRINDGRADVEEETANLLIDLDLISTYSRENVAGKRSQWYRLDRTEKKEFNRHLLLFAILDRYEGLGMSFSFYDLLEGYNSPGNIFCLTEQGLDFKLREIAEHWPNQVSYTQTAGNRVFQLTGPLNKWAVLTEYYA